MPDPDQPRAHPEVDREHDTSNNAFDTATGYSGQGYTLAREQAEGARHPSGHPLTGDPAHVDVPAEDPQGRDIPADVGHRAWFDPRTGEAHGSGSGAGPDGNAEDFDDGTAGA